MSRGARGKERGQGEKGEYKIFNFLRDFYGDFPGGSDDKESACNPGTLGFIPGLGRSPGGGHSNLLQYFCLENPIDKGV